MTSNFLLFILRLPSCIMSGTNTVRTVVALITALCVATMFAGSAAAVPLDDTVELDDGDGVVDINLESESDDSGGSGSGSAAVETGQGGAAGEAGAGVDTDDPSVTVAAEGEAGPAGDKQGAGVECELSQESAQNPQDACEVDAPGDGEVPDPGEEVPIPIDDLLPA